MTSKSSIPATNIEALPRYIRALRNPASTPQEIAAAEECLYGLAWFCDGADSGEVEYSPTNNMWDSQEHLFNEERFGKETPDGSCTYPECNNSRRSRGLCHGHYQAWRSHERKGTATPEALLMKHGIVLPAEVKGGSPVNGHKLFKLAAVEGGAA